MDLPLKDIVILDFSQFLAGPVATLRLQDLGARVIKVEQPKIGDISRKKLVLANQFIDEDTLSFNVMNRGKESIVFDLKNSIDLKRIKKLLKSVDVMIHNYRPGVMEKFGLDYETLSKTHPKLIYGWINGYGDISQYKDRPGVDILAQSISGLCHITGSKLQRPITFGAAITDMNASIQMALGISSLLYRRTKSKKGGIVETSLIESSFDVQFDLLATYLHLGEKSLPKSTKEESAHTMVPAPAGIYRTKDGYITLAMYPVDKLLEILNLDSEPYKDPTTWWENRDEILESLSEVFKLNTSKNWLKLLDNHDVWVAPLNSQEDIVNQKILEELDMVREIDDIKVKTLTSPLTIDHERNFSSKKAPSIGEDTEKIIAEFDL